MSISELQAVSPLEIPDWDGQIGDLDGSSFFHSSAWARVLQDTYGYRPLYLVSSPDNRIQGVLPLMAVRSRITGRRGVCLPFSDFCPPVGAAAAKDTGQRFWQRCVEIGRTGRWKHIEIRGEADSLAGQPSAMAYLEHTLDLSIGPDSLFRALPGSTRRAVRKARAVGLETRFSTSPESIDAFCRLNRITRRAHGLPPQPSAFFRNLQRHVLGNAMGQVVLALYRGSPIAGALFMHFGTSALFKYGASDPRHRELRGNNLVMWEAIRHYAERGCSTLSLGRTRPSNEGLRRFKMGWAPSERAVRYYRFDLKRSAFVRRVTPAAPPYTLFFKYLPLPFARTIGNLAYRHMG